MLTHGTHTIPCYRFSRFGQLAVTQKSQTSHEVTYWVRYKSALVLLVVSKERDSWYKLNLYVQIDH